MTPSVEALTRLFWQDYKGRLWKIPTIKARLKFRIPCHAALREHVFERDQYTCQSCGAKTTGNTEDYNGCDTLKCPLPPAPFKTKSVGNFLVLAHVVSTDEGGSHEINNLITLCDCCNSRKSQTVLKEGVR